MNKWAKALVILIVLFFLFVPLIIATKYIALTQLYNHFVTNLSNLTGINQYLINAGVVLMMIPLYFGIRMFFSFNRKRRLIGIFLLAAFLIVYNLGLYQLTKDIQFSFYDEGEIRTLKWYALTPEGVKFYDRSGRDPDYGIPLKPVTPEVIRNLKLIEKGEFNPVDPEKAIWFNPTTGDPQIWYYQSAGGSFEFFNKPGYHPLTGETLKPVNKQIHFEWLDKGKKGELRYSGRIENSELTQKPEKKDETKEKTKASANDGRFIAYKNGTVLDTKTNLMWAGQNNAAIVNWQGAKSHCENYRGGNYMDWRMPTQDELAGLYDANKTYECKEGNDVHLTELIRLPFAWVWASETRGSDAAIFAFINGKGLWNLKAANFAALPVRSGK